MARRGGPRSGETAGRIRPRRFPRTHATVGLYLSRHLRYDSCRLDRRGILATLGCELRSGQGIGMHGGRCAGQVLPRRPFAEKHELGERQLAAPGLSYLRLATDTGTALGLVLVGRIWHWPNDQRRPAGSAWARSERLFYNTRLPG